MRNGIILVGAIACSGCAMDGALTIAPACKPNPCGPPVVVRSCDSGSSPQSFPAPLPPPRMPEPVADPGALSPILDPGPLPEPAPIAVPPAPLPTTRWKPVRVETK